MSARCHRQRGVTLVELLLSLTISAVLLAGMSRLFTSTLEARALIQEQQALNQRARFAMERMVTALQSTSRLIIPLSDRVATSLVENIREESVPASSPPTGSSKATAVLAVALPVIRDVNLDGVADADNDGDGRVDEDWGRDNTNDGANGLRDIDDNGDGRVDEAFFGGANDDDEYLFIADEDPVNGIDDDNDGTIDEDAGADMNDDNEPGIAGVDDDGDGSVDEGSDNDDDEDGASDEDWLDTLTFYLSDSNLMERATVPFDTDGDGDADGRDRQATIIASGVTWIRFERLAGADGSPLVDISLTLTSGAINASLTTRVRVGAVN